MKLKFKLFCFLLIFCFNLSITSVFAASTKMYVTANVNVRSEMSIKSNKVLVAKKGTQVLQLKKMNKTWSKIKTSGKIGYVKNRYLTTKKPIIKPKYSASYFRRAGVIHWGGWRWTWYSTREGYAGKVYGIPGRHTDQYGYIRDKNGYLCLASSRLKKGTVVNTPFGSKGKVYDCGCAKNTLDVYTTW